MATRIKAKLPSILQRLTVANRSAAEQREAEAEDREAKRRGRYYKGVARRIRHGILSQEEIQSLRDDKRRVERIREAIE